MTSPRFLDTNVLIRAFVDGDHHIGERARSLLDRIYQGEERVVTSQLVIFETIFTLQRSYNVSRGKIREIITDLLSLQNIEIPDRALILDALAIYVNNSVSFVDAHHIALMNLLNISEIYSWDRDFDRFPGVIRIEP